jgi:hypothetical protein
VLPVISKYISQKREGNATTLYASLYRIVKDLIKNQNSLELESGFIWNHITNNLSGDYIPGKKYSFDSSEFGVISQKFIIETLMEVFGAKPSRNRRDKRRLVFDKDKLERLGNIYDVDIEIKVGQQQCSSVTHETDVTDVGLDRHLREQSTDEKIEEKGQENKKSYNKSNENGNEVLSDNEAKTPGIPVEPSQASHVSHAQQQ